MREQNRHHSGSNPESEEEEFKKYIREIKDLHVDAIDEGQRVLIVDDVLATGGTAKATADLVKASGGKVVCAAFLVELTGLGGRKLLDCPVHSLVRY